jgi:hypothetical protein
VKYILFFILLSPHYYVFANSKNIPVNISYMKGNVLSITNDTYQESYRDVCSAFRGTKNKLVKGLQEIREELNLNLLQNKNDLKHCSSAFKEWEDSFNRQKSSCSMYHNAKGLSESKKERYKSYCIGATSSQKRHFKYLQEIAKKAERLLDDTVNEGYSLNIYKYLNYERFNIYKGLFGVNLISDDSEIKGSFLSCDLSSEKKIIDSEDVFKLMKFGILVDKGIQQGRYYAESEIPSFKFYQYNQTTKYKNPGVQVPGTDPLLISYQWLYGYDIFTDNSKMRSFFQYLKTNSKLTLNFMINDSIQVKKTRTDEVNIKWLANSFGDVFYGCMAFYEYKQKYYLSNSYKYDLTIDELLILKDKKKLEEENKYKKEQSANKQAYNAELERKKEEKIILSQWAKIHGISKFGYLSTVSLNVLNRDVRNRSLKNGEYIPLDSSGSYHIKQAIEGGYLFLGNDRQLPIIVKTNKQAFEGEGILKITQIIKYIGVDNYINILGVNRQAIFVEAL